MQHTPHALRLHAPAPPADEGALTDWATAMPTALLAHPRLTAGDRLLGGYLWALAGRRAGQLVRTTHAALADALAMPASTLRDSLARLAAAGYVSLIAARTGQPALGGGAELAVHGPHALTAAREHRPADRAQRELPLTPQDIVSECRATAIAISEALAGRDGRRHTVQQWLIVGAALMAHGVPVVARRAKADGPPVRVALARDDVLTATHSAARRRDAGAAWYAYMRDRISHAAGVPMRWPSREAVREAAEGIGWAWRPEWAHSPADLARAARDAREDDT